jgi:hypothetical protein
VPGSATGTAADRLPGGPVAPPRATRAVGDDDRSRGARGERAPDADAVAGTPSANGPAPGGGALRPGATTAAATVDPGPDATARSEGTGHPEAEHRPVGPTLGGVGAPLLPPSTGTSGEARRPVHRHPEYLVDADPWAEHAADPAQRRLVTPPVLGEDER